EREATDRSPSQPARDHLAGAVGQHHLERLEALDRAHRDPPDHAGEGDAGSRLRLGDPNRAGHRRRPRVQLRGEALLITLGQPSEEATKRARHGDPRQRAGSDPEAKISTRRDFENQTMMPSAAAATTVTTIRIARCPPPEVPYFTTSG